MKKRPDLTTLPLDIDQNPKESLTLIKEHHQLPQFQDDQPFIDLLPTELEIQLLLMLPFESWRSLYKTSTHWRAMVVTAAIPFFNSVEVKDELKTILRFNFQKLTSDLKANVNSILGRKERQQVSELVEKVELLNNPLEKLELIHNCLISMAGVVDASRSNPCLFLPNSTPSLKWLLATDYLGKAPLNKMKEPWLQTIYQFLVFFPEHPLAKKSATALEDNVIDATLLISDKVEKANSNTVRRLDF